MFKWIDSDQGKVKVFLNKIKIFSKRPLPPCMNIFGIFFNISPFIPAVVRCYKCQRFGHGSNYCRSTPRCESCGFTHTDECSEPIKCVNCNKAHKASSRECIYFAFNKEVNNIKTLHKISTVEAIFLTNQRYRHNLQALGSIIIDTLNPYIENFELDNIVNDQEEIASVRIFTPTPPPQKVVPDSERVPGFLNLEGASQINLTNSQSITSNSTPLLYQPLPVFTSSSQNSIPPFNLTTALPLLQQIALPLDL